MSDTKQLIAELRRWARPNTTHSEKLVNRAADAIEAQEARIEALEAELASLEENRHVAAQLSHQYRNRAERAEQERDAERAHMQSLAKWVGVPESTPSVEIACEVSSRLEDLSAYTTRIREEAVGKD